MEKYEKNLDVIALRIKTASDLLQCYLNFCENENGLNNIKSQKELASHAIFFFENFKTQQSLIESALFTLTHEYNILYDLFDEQERAGAANA